MFVYIGIIFMVFAFVTLSLDKRIKADTGIAFLLIGVLSVFAGIRESTGCDYDSYLSHFDKATTIWDYRKVQWNFEPGYEYLVSVCKTLVPSFHFFLFVFALLTLLLAYRLFRKNSSLPLLSFLLFFSFTYFMQIMGQMRQPFAIVLLFLFLPLLTKGKKDVLLFILVTCVIAYYFHKSLFIMVPALLLANRYISRSFVVFCTGCCLVFCFAVARVNVIGYVPDGFYLKPIIQQYVENNQAPLITGGMLDKIGTLCMISAFYFKYHLYEERKIRVYYNLYFFSVCLYFLLFRISLEFAARGTQSLSFFSFLLFPYIYKRVELRKEKQLILALIYLLSLYVSSGVLTHEAYIPYKSIF